MGASRVMCEKVWPGIGFRVEEQDISKLTTWSIAQDKHAVVVHLQGSIRRLETELSGANGAYAPAMPGEVWVVPANARYSSLALGKTVRFAELHLDPAKFPEIAGNTVCPSAVRARAGHYDAFLHRAVEHLWRLATQQDDLALLTAQSLGQAVYLHFFREYTAEDPAVARSGHRPRLGPAEEILIREYIQDNLGTTIRLEPLLALAGMKLHEFLPAFRAAFGTTPAQYIIEQRLRRARHLLLATRRNITEIAYETGFSSHAHLTTVFRTRMAMTPREFRTSQAR